MYQENASLACMYAIPVVLILPTLEPHLPRWQGHWSPAVRSAALPVRAAGPAREQVDQRMVLALTGTAASAPDAAFGTTLFKPGLEPAPRTVLRYLV